MSSTNNQNNEKITITTFNNECPICFSDLNDETLKGIIKLSCSHSVCLECFLNQVKSRYNDLKYFKCCLCRTGLIPEELEEKLRKMNNSDFITFYHQNKRDLTGDDLTTLERFFNIYRQDDLQSYRNKIFLIRDIQRLITMIRVIRENRTDESLWSLWDTKPEHIDDRINIIQESMERQLQREEQERRRNEDMRRLREEEEEKNEGLREQYPIFFNDERLTKILDSWKLRKNTTGYKIIQILINNNGTITPRELKNIINNKKSITHSTFRTNLFKLKDNNYIDLTFNGQVLTGIKLTETYKEGLN